MSASRALVLFCVLFVGAAPVVRGHESPPTPKQIQELNEIARRLSASGGGVTPELLPGLDELLLSHGRHDLEHAIERQRQQGPSAANVSQALVAIQYFRYVVARYQAAASLAVGLARAGPEDLARVMVQLLREIDRPATPGALEHLSKDASPEIRAMVGWILPAYWQFKARGLPQREQWVRGVAHRLANDCDPRVVSSVVSHLLEIRDRSAFRAVLKRLDDDRTFVSPNVGFLYLSSSPLSESVRNALLGHLRFKVGRLAPDAPAPEDLRAWIEDAGGIEEMLRVDEPGWVRVADRILLMGRGQTRPLREPLPKLDVNLRSWSLAYVGGLPSLTARLEILHKGEVVQVAGPHRCYLGHGSVVTASRSGPAFTEAPSSGDQLWRVRCVAIPATDGKVRLRVVIWVSTEVGLGCR